MKKNSSWKRMNLIMNSLYKKENEKWENTKASAEAE